MCILWPSSCDRGTLVLLFWHEEYLFFIPYYCLFYVNIYIVREGVKHIQGKNCGSKKKCWARKKKFCPQKFVYKKILVKKSFGSKKMMAPTNSWFQKKIEWILGPKKCWAIILSPKKWLKNYLGPTKFGFRRIFGPKMFGSKKNVGSTNFLSQKILGKNSYESNKFWVKKKLSFKYLGYLEISDAKNVGT